MASLQSWPEEALPLCYRIISEQDQIEAIFKVCLSEGIEQQNYNLITNLLPNIEVRAKVILSLARKIGELIPAKGRPPKWGEVAMDINALSSQILRVIERVRSECQTNRYITVAKLLEVGHQKAVDIGHRVEAIPRSDRVPDIFYEELLGEE